MTTNQQMNVDHTAIKTNQAVIIILNLIAFILNLPWLAGLVAVAMILGALMKISGFGFVYHILKSAKLLQAEILLDNPEPYHFAQGFGGLVMVAGTTSLIVGASTLGWGLVWVVTALAALNLFGGFCLGCAVYYWLSRWDVPGFKKSPPEGTFPGMRSSVKVKYGHD